MRIRLLPLLFACSLVAVVLAQALVAAPIADHLERAKVLLQRLKLPPSPQPGLESYDFVQDNYELVREMQKECNAAEDHYATEGIPDRQMTDALARLHLIMACAGILINDHEVFELNVQAGCRVLRAAYGYDQGRCLEALANLGNDYTIGAQPLSVFYQRLKGGYEAVRENSKEVEIRFERSSNLVPLSELGVRALPGASPYAQAFAQSLDSRLREPVEKNWFITYYLDQAAQRQMAIQPTDYFAVNPGNVEKTQWVAQVGTEFRNLNPVTLKLRIPEGKYYFYKRGEAVTDAKANLEVGGEGARIPKTAIVKVDESGTRVSTELLYASDATPLTFRPEFSLLDFRLGKDNEAGGLEGAVGGRMFQRFGQHLALQTQGEFEFRKHRDLMDLDQVLANIPSQYLPREQRDPFDFSAREFQLDIGPVVRVKNLQFAALQSLRYVKRNTWDDGGYIGQFFFNAGYLFKYGQVGLFATTSNIDESVVNAVQFDDVLFEETYLKVADQFGVNFQLGPPNSRNIGYFEGSAGYIKMATVESAFGGNLRYIQPLPWERFRDRLAVTAEVGYNEGFIKSTENNLRVGIGLRFGKWTRPSDFTQANQGAVPVIVPRIRYETLTRIVRHGNRRPIADAGPDQIGVDWRNGQIVLDGSGSNDPDGDSLTYAWRAVKPLVALQDPNTAHPRFTPSNAEDYTFELIVKDSFGLESEPDTVRVTTLRIVQPKVLDFRVDNALFRTPGCQGAVPPTLFWKVQDAARITISNTSIDKTVTAAVDEGQVQVNPTETITYTLTAFNLVNEAVSATVTVTVRPCLPVINSFTATPPEIRSGGTSVLTWQVESAETLRLTNDGTSRDLTGTSITVNPTKTTVYTLTAYNRAGEIVSAEVTVTVKDALPAIRSFTATPAEISAGENSVLAWEVENASRITLTNGGDVQDLTGSQSRTVAPAQTTVYTLNVFNNAGESATAQVTVTVKDRLPRILSFTASPPEIRKGESAVLAWQLENAYRMTLTNGGNQVQSPVTPYLVTPDQTTVYTLTVFNRTGETTTAQVTVTVKPKMLVIRSFAANPPEIQPTQSSVLSWQIDQADADSRISLTNGPSNLGPTGTYAVTPSATTIYTLNACNTAGECATASVTVVVRELPVISLFMAIPPEIDLGQTSTLSWKVSSASQVSITNVPVPIDPRQLEGTKVVSPLETTIYTINACNVRGDCVSSSLTVTVRQVLPPIEITYFRANPEEIEEGGQSTLSWEVHNASRVTIPEANFDNSQVTNPYINSLTVAPRVATTYTLIACNAADVCRSKSVTVTVSPPAVPRILYFTANPPLIDQAEHRYSDLSWEIVGATQLTITNLSDDGIPFQFKDSRRVSPAQTTTYTIAACNAGGRCASAAVTLVVQESAPVSRSSPSLSQESGRWP